MENKKRLIDANDYLTELKKSHDDIMQDPNIGKPMKWRESVCFGRAVNVLVKMPTVDAVEVVHGRWDEIPNKYMSVSTKNGSYSGHATSCSVCHEINPNAFKTNYCPNCGAKMDGDRDA